MEIAYVQGENHCTCDVPFCYFEAGQKVWTALYPGIQIRHGVLCLIAGSFAVMGKPLINQVKQFQFRWISKFQHVTPTPSAMSQDSLLQGEPLLAPPGISKANSAASWQRSVVAVTGTSAHPLNERNANHYPNYYPNHSIIVPI